MDKIDKVEILGQEVSVVYKKTGDNWGFSDPDKKRIILSVKCLKMNNKDHFGVLFHEATHYIFHLTGLSYMDGNEEEAYVRCIENLVMPWYMENKDILD